MERRALLFLVVALVVLASHIVHGRAAAAAEWPVWGPAWASCRGAVEECLIHYDVGSGGGGGGGGARRRLDGAYPTQYISYAALMRDSVPCSVPGASYYNCRPGASANPYTRGCSAITQCRD